MPYLACYPQVLASLPSLQSAAHGQGLVSVRDDAVVRRIPLLAAVGQVPVSSLAMEMLRVGTGSPAVDLFLDPHGVRELQVAELVVPTQSGGDVWLHFAFGVTNAFEIAIRALVYPQTARHFRDDHGL